MSHPDQPPPNQVNQSQQSGGLNLGAYNRFQRLEIGDVIAGDKIVVQTLQLIVYTGPDKPVDPVARQALERAYRSEVAARYAVWRRRYATLPMQARVSPDADDAKMIVLEREDLVFHTTLRKHYQTSPEVQPDVSAPADSTLSIETFTDLREVLRRFQDIILLAPPGGGKTTALMRLALDLAEEGLQSDSDPSLPLPIFARLGGLRRGESLESLLQRELVNASLTIFRKGIKHVQLPAHRQLAALLPDLFTNGRVVLLWDGLNETPTDLFRPTVTAIHELASKFLPTIHGSNTSITTCRVEDFTVLLDEQEAAAPPLQQVTLGELDSSTTEALIVSQLGVETGQRMLIALAQPQHQALRSLVRTPLLLKMLCEVYAFEQKLPTNRGKLLEAFVQTRWEWESQRQPERWIARTRQEKVFARLAFAMTEGYGRGTSVDWKWARRIIGQVDDTIEPEQFQQLAQAADILEGLDNGQTVRFSHQLLQEYFAALALEAELAFLKQPHLQQTLRWKQQQSAWQKKLSQYIAVGRRTGWEETLFLLAGLREDAVYLKELTAQMTRRPLETAQLLSGDQQATFLHDEIRQAALKQLAIPDISTEQRLDAGRALGLLGDARFPVTTDEWQTSMAQRGTALTDQGEHYWRYVPSGAYAIGGWDKDEPVTEHTLAPFWIARLPISVAQFARFVAEGYQNNEFWTPNGLQWRGKRTAPDTWYNSRYSQANHPVVNITWYEATAFSNWLTRQFAESLPVNHVLRLPTEAEWEVAAAYAGPGARRTYPWGEAEPTPAHAVYDAWGLEAAAPVGLCPHGMAACGALDMAGNVWEWTSSRYKMYPTAAHTYAKDFTQDNFDVPWRGGNFWLGSTFVRCGARYWFRPYLRFINLGIRVVLAPLLAQMS
jgi:formylglycine-generating enzyme required for sulfatase activity